VNNKASKPATSKSEPSGYCTEYRHYKTGKLMRAKDYGYKAWPFGGGR
jgi:hypothetical protein